MRGHFQATLHGYIHHSVQVDEATAEIYRCRGLSRQPCRCAAGDKASAGTLSQARVKRQAGTRQCTCHNQEPA